MLRRSSAVVTTLALALASAPLPARAAEPAAPPSSYDTVVLRDGSVLRGTILELAPGRQLVIAVAAGETRTIAWAQVASTALAGQATAPTAGPEGPVPPTMSEPTPGPSRPRIAIEVLSRRPTEVHLFEAGFPAQVLGVKTGSAAYYAAARTVCRAPCGKVIDGGAGNPYFFGGDRLVPSRPLYLRDLEGDYVARVRPGRTRLLAGGIAAAGFGYAGTLTGGLLVGITRGETRTAGAVVLGAGVALLITGIVMIVKGRTRYTLQRR